MINSTISGICSKLSSLFEDYSVYKESVLQDLDPPCFIVRLNSPDRVDRLNSNFMLNNQYQIIFFPKVDGTEQSQMNEVLMTLMEQMEFITLPSGDMLRGTNMMTESADDTLHFLVNYNVSMRQIRTGTDMENLTLTEGLNNDY